MRLPPFTRKTLATRLCLFVMLLSCAALAGCQRRVEQTATQATAPPPQSSQATPAPLASNSPVAATPTPLQVSIAPPQPSEVEGALARVYRDAVVAADAGRGVNALTADFNGDGSEDIAVVVKPNSAQLSEINSENALWIVVDPQRVSPPQKIRADERLPTPAPVKVEADDTLLAIIHGYKSAGWRNADAKQTYLLKNAVGEEMKAQLVGAARVNTDKRPLPLLRGDLIWQKLSGKTGCLYWTGAKYGWYDSPPPPPSNVKNPPAHTDAR